VHDLGVPPHSGRIAVAHTLDDRIETFFMRALWGSGSGGLGSIAAVRGRIVRPLLGIGREDLRSWLERDGEPWREDESNSDVTRTRANVRATLVPAAAQVNPNFRSALERTMDLVAGDDELLSSMADAFARDFAAIDARSVTFNRNLMQSLDPTMARRTIRAALKRAFPDASRMEAHHTEALVNGLRSSQFSHDLPGGLRAFGEYDSMVVCSSDDVEPRVAPSLLLMPGRDLARRCGSRFAPR
jgi:tRNA(Ile)-lysidine synthase